MTTVYAPNTGGKGHLLPSDKFVEYYDLRARLLDEGRDPDEADDILKERMKMDNIQPYDYHDYANLFPLLEDEELEELADSMRQHGFFPDEPIVLLDGKILDGRNRYWAAQRAGVDPVVAQYEGDDPLGFVIAKNLRRRHLSSSQRATLALEIMPLLEEQAKERQGARTDLGDNIPELIPGSSGEAREQAAAMMETNPRYVSDAKRLEREAPGLLAMVRRDELSIPKAIRILTGAPDLVDDLTTGQRTIPDVMEVIDFRERDAEEIADSFDEGVEDSTTADDGQPPAWVTGDDEAVGPSADEQGEGEADEHDDEDEDFGTVYEAGCYRLRKYIFEQYGKQTYCVRWSKEVGTISEVILFDQYTSRGDANWQFDEHTRAIDALVRVEEREQPVEQAQPSADKPVGLVDDLPRMTDYLAGHNDPTAELCNQLLRLGNEADTWLAAYDKFVERVENERERARLEQNWRYLTGLYRANVYIVKRLEILRDRPQYILDVQDRMLEASTNELRELRIEVYEARLGNQEMDAPLNALLATLAEMVENQELVDAADAA